MKMENQEDAKPHFLKGENVAWTIEMQFLETKS